MTLRSGWEGTVRTKAFRYIAESMLHFITTDIFSYSKIDRSLMTPTYTADALPFHAFKFLGDSAVA